jgi:hypothetical protein
MLIADEKGFTRDGGQGGGRRRTTEGFAIYLLEELQLSADAGNTPNCPIDCDCCH